MRGSHVPACLVVVTAFLAGCSGGGSNGEPVAGAFDDIDVDATSTTGILIGVVVDQAIRPIQGVTITITKPDGAEQSDETDAQGRFAFGNLPPGSYIIRANHPQFTSAQASAEVEAGVEDPPVVRILLERLFEQDPYSELIKFDGYIACAYAVGASSTCVNDYTRITGERCVPQSNPPQCYCAGGCFRDQNLSQQGGNIREYVAAIGPGWQSIVIEETWEPTSELGQNMGFVVSYFSRPNAQHSFGSENGPNPLRLEFVTGEEHESGSAGDGEPDMIPSEGFNELFVFFSAGSGSVAINQPFRAFQTTFYYGIPPDGWSFVETGMVPF